MPDYFEQQQRQTVRRSVMSGIDSAGEYEEEYRDRVISMDELINESRMAGESGFVKSSIKKDERVGGRISNRISNRLSKKVDQDISLKLAKRMTVRGLPEMEHKEFHEIETQTEQQGSTGQEVQTSDEMFHDFALIY